MGYVKRIIKSGGILEIEKYFTGRLGKKIERSFNENITPERIKKINEKNAEIKLVRIINTNFKNGDIHLVLTYKNEVSEVDSKKSLSKFLRKLRNKYKLAGFGLMYIAVTEYENKRLHHHLIINSINNSYKYITDSWTNGIPRLTPLYSYPDFTELAKYLIKETNKTFNREDSNFRKRWCSSQSLKKPIVKIKKMKRKNISEHYEDVKGYILIAEQSNTYFCEFFGTYFQRAKYKKIE